MPIKGESQGGKQEVHFLPEADYGTNASFPGERRRRQERATVLWKLPRQGESQGVKREVHFLPEDD